MYQLKQAAREDLPQILALLEEADLPVAGVEEHVDAFVLARDGERLVGCIGLEVYGDVGLLRSLAVRSDARGSGVGRLLVERLLGSARERCIETMYLLTTTADRYFPRFGFEPVPRSQADGRLQESLEFRGACPDTAVCMRRRL